MAKSDSERRSDLQRRISNANETISDLNKRSLWLKIKINHVLELIGETPQFQFDTDDACRVAMNLDLKKAFEQYRIMGDAGRRGVLTELKNSLTQIEADIEGCDARIVTCRQQLANPENQTIKKKKDAPPLAFMKKDARTDSSQIQQTKTTTSASMAQAPKKKIRSVSNSIDDYKHEVSLHVAKTVAAGICLLLIVSGFGFWYHSSQQQYRHELALKSLKTATSSTKSDLSNRIDGVDKSIASLKKEFKERLDTLKQDIEKAFGRFEESNKQITLNNQGWIEKFADTTNRQYKDLVSLQGKQLDKQFDSLSTIVAEIQRSQKSIQETSENNKKRTEFLLDKLENVKKILEEIRDSPGTAFYRLLSPDSWAWVTAIFIA